MKSYIAKCRFQKLLAFRKVYLKPNFKMKNEKMKKLMHSNEEASCYLSFN